ncbi:hypothetical protein KBD08_04060 [Candidatus Babeliales bacterium]|nr:hypothetical protein [Candidatus Babeliales bacterium]
MYKIITILIILFIINQLCFGWISAVSFILMLIMMRKYRLGFYDGCIWGIVTYLIHTLWIVSSVGSRCNALSAIEMWILLAIWSGLLSGLWWMNYQRYPIISTMTYWYIMTRYSLLIVGLCEGYSLCNPALCIVDCGWLAPMIWYTHDIGIWFVCVIVAQYLDQVPKRLVVLGALLGLVLDYGYPYHYPTTNHHFLPLHVPLPLHTHVDQAGQAVAHTIEKNLQKDREVTCIIFPESTFCWDLNRYHYFIGQWCTCAGQVPILICAHLCKGNVSYNACLLLHNNSVRRWYCKQHRMPIIERNIWVNRWLHNLPSYVETVPYQQGDDIFEIGSCRYQIYICSELFHDIKPVAGYPVILVWNDTWLNTMLIHRLSLRFIVYFELKHGVKVFHLATSGCTNIV